MPVPVNIDKAPQENVWFYNFYDSRSNSTGSKLFYKSDFEESFFNSKTGVDFCNNSLAQVGTQHNKTNKMFIKLSKILNEQYKIFAEYYNNISLVEIKSVTSSVISELIALSPDAFSLELTNEESIFYTFKKEDYSFYIHQYFETEDDGFNATLISFKGADKIDSINGDINNVLTSIESKISNNISHNLNLALLNELSY
jgi:predicted HTH domain antitoxin